MSTATERHYTVTEVAEMWSLSTRTIRRMLEKESGIMVIGHPGNSRRHRYQRLRIPESVLQRIHNRMLTAPITNGERKVARHKA